MCYAQKLCLNYVVFFFWRGTLHFYESPYGRQPVKHIVTKSKLYFLLSAFRFRIILYSFGGRLRSSRFKRNGVKKKSEEIRTYTYIICVSEVCT